MTKKVLPPLKSVAYLVPVGPDNGSIVNAFAASFESLRKHHPDVSVMVYHHDLEPAEVEYFTGLPEVMCFPLGGVSLIDLLLLTPGDTLFLDTDTEVVGSLDDCFRSEVPWMQASAGPIAAPEHAMGDALGMIQWQTFGWRGDLDQLELYGSNAVYVPQRCKVDLYRAKELLWCLSGLDAAAGIDTERLALSVALQEANDYELPELAPRTMDHRDEVGAGTGDWFERVHGPRAACTIDYVGSVYLPSSLR